MLAPDFGSHILGKRSHFSSGFSVEKHLLLYSACPPRPALPPAPAGRSCTALATRARRLFNLFCPFSQVVPWSSPAAPDFLFLLSSHLPPLCSALFSLCSPLSSPLFSLSSCPRWIPSSIPRVLSNCLLALLSPCPSPLSALPLSLLSVFSLLSPLPAPRVTVFAAHRACQHDRFP